MTLTITHKYLRNLMDNLTEENFTDLLVELQYSTLIIPATEYDGVPIVELDGRQYIPLFTDIHEFNRFRGDEEYRAVDHEFNTYLELLQSGKSPGYLINPDSEKFQITYEFLKYIEPNHIFDQEYQVFTAKEIRKIKDSFDNRELNEFINDESNRHDLANLIKRLARSDLLTLLISDKDYSDEAEDGVISPLGKIPKCIYEIGDKNYILLFSREPTKDVVPDDSTFKYVEIVNFPLLAEEVLNNDFDGFILNVSEENITLPREHLRDYMKDLSCPVLDDYSMYAFTIQEEVSDFEIIREILMTVLSILLVIISTHTLFFIAYGYFMGGDPFIALKNFYNIIFNVR